jgi:hypothetical protein
LNKYKGYFIVTRVIFSGRFHFTYLDEATRAIVDGYDGGPGFAARASNWPNTIAAALNKIQNLFGEQVTRRSSRYWINNTRLQLPSLHAK